MFIPDFNISFKKLILGADSISFGVHPLASTGFIILAAPNLYTKQRLT